jgi:hypothetical protein
MGYGAPAMAMQGLFYNQPCSYYGAAFLGAAWGLKKEKR